MSIKYSGKGQASDNLSVNSGYHPCCNGHEFPALTVPRQLGLQNGESGKQVDRQQAYLQNGKVGWAWGQVPPSLQ